ncbi:hypothetical protein FHU38_000714 [Saccharomonospora amisosensis]|uniref:Uncharacterized protein n=2 Tax=Saccharomonospora TaxID=1851 RepID=H5WY11_9PSEU|nr:MULTISPECIES: hypothetical protein [Saccharomonospora]EHR52878.1 hypothetical protein SacmaDRAFT_4704 [Saccharomonospora marina XMU15]NIJ10370.1 hypothetical protein [Saccharomonospora amisosensis]
MSEETIQLELNDAGVSPGLPMPSNSRDRIQDVPYRPVEFRDDDLPAALERCAGWLRQAQQWLGEPVDVLAVHLDYDERDGYPYYDLKLLCNEEDLAGVPLALRERKDTVRS